MTLHDRDSVREQLVDSVFSGNNMVDKDEYPRHRAHDHGRVQRVQPPVITTPVAMTGAERAACELTDERYLASRPPYRLSA